MSSAAPPASPLALLAPVCAAQRPQPLRFIHKALRVLLMQALQASGAMDAGEPDERRRIVDEVERTLACCADHLAQERHFLLEPLRRRSPRAVLAFEADHQEQLEAIDTLRLLLQRLRDAGAHAVAPHALAYELHLRLSDFIADTLAHLVEEETTLTRSLWDHFGDGELHGLMAALHAAWSAQDTALCLPCMARALSLPELAGMVADLRRHGSAAAADALSAALRQALPLR